MGTAIWKGRRRRVALVGVGVAIAALMQTGLLAVTSDTGRYGSYDVLSDTFTATPPAHHRIQTADYNGSSCGSFVDDTSFGPYGDTIDLTTGATTFGSYTKVCVRNSGTQAADIYLSFDPTSFADVESGTCEATEADAGDTSCADGTAGELGAILNFGMTFSSNGLFTCPGATDGTTVSGTFTDLPTAPVMLVDDLAAGGTCTLSYAPALKSGVTENEKLLAQTDSVRWEILFTAQDA